jgi:signal transduction histidine kinase
MSNNLLDEELEGKLILIIDDNPLNLRILEDQLKSFNFQVKLCKSGLEGIEFLEETIPDLILLDIMMPIMDGFQVADAIFANEKLKNIPIIFITAKTQTDDVVRGLSMGAVDYILKPFNPEELNARVKTHLKIKSYQDVLEAQNKKLSLLNKEKNHFLAVTAHDLKNPLYNIRLLSKTIIEENLNGEDLKEFTQDILTTSDRMLNLIADLLDINAIEQGSMKIELSEIDIIELTFGICDIYHERAKVKGITIHFDPQLEHLSVLGDRRLLQQVLDNLVSNAIKYSPHNKNVYIRLLSNSQVARFEIKDEGIGIKEEEKHKLFGKFSKLSTLPTGDESSSGLGLSIVKQYVEVMGGRVWCESTYGEGASFFFELNLAPNDSE